MIASSAIGFLLSDGEKRRLGWIRAMRRCLIRISAVIRYEQPALADLLVRVDLNTTQQERELTLLMHRCAQRLLSGIKLHMLFAEETARLRAYGVLSEEDRAPFEGVIAQLGTARLPEQLRQIDQADERLRAREQVLEREGAKRVRLIRTLGVSLGAAIFLILI